MQGAKLIGVNHTPSILKNHPGIHSFAAVPEKIQITQIAERFDAVEEFVPMSRLNFNVDAVEFTPTGDIPMQAKHKPAPHFPQHATNNEVHLPIVQEPVKSSPLSQVATKDPVNVLEEKPFYTIEEIFSVFQGFCQYEEFKKLDNRLAIFSRRKNQVFKVFKKGNSQNKRTKKEHIRYEEFKPAELESWRKMKSLEEEKIRSQAQNTTLKLMSTKDDREKVKRQIKVTLNKLSPSNFTKLQVELLTLAKDSREALAYLIQTIFEKSWAEVKYTAMYAQLCKSLKEEFEGFLFDCESPSKKNQNWFRYCLLSHLQTAFEDNLDSPSKSAEEKALLHKKRYHGSVRFIGELFKVNIITMNIIQEIVEALINLKEKDPLVINEEKLEVACVLISTAGSMNEKKKLQPETDKIFAYLSEILSVNASISSKVKFTIMNLMDDRAAGWTKDVSEEPKKVEEIRSEFQTELDRKKY